MWQYGDGEYGAEGGRGARVYAQRGCRGTC